MKTFKTVRRLLRILKSENTPKELYRKTQLQIGFLLSNYNTQSRKNYRRFKVSELRESNQVARVINSIVSCKKLTEVESSKLKNLYISDVITLDTLLDLRCYLPHDNTHSFKKLLSDKYISASGILTYVDKLIERLEKREKKSVSSKILTPIKNDIKVSNKAEISTRNLSEEISKLLAKGVEAGIALYLASNITEEYLDSYLAFCHVIGEEGYVTSLGNPISAEEMNELCVQLVYYIDNSI